MSIQEYFLGGTSPEGFRTKFREQIHRPGFYTYILKGGPGTGKSTLMKKAVERFKDHDLSVYRCSSDINSLDAVVIEDKGIIIVDGTAPHVFEAEYPGAFQEVINLGKFWHSEKLRQHSDAVRYCFDENGKYHRRVKHYVEAFSAVNTDIYNNAEESLDKLKLSAYADRLSKKLITRSSSGKKGKTEFRQLSAFTTENYKTLPIEGDYSVYFIRDDYFAGGDFLLRDLADRFTKNGYDVIVSECTMLRNFTFEHIICKELNLAFITGNFFNRLKPDKENIINFARFYDKETLDRKKQRISFDKKASLELSHEAADTLSTALSIHDELEKFYIGALDTEKLNAMTEELLEELGK